MTATLTLEAAREIAAEHGLGENFVAANFQHCIDSHGKECRRAGTTEIVACWATDRHGRYDSAAMFRGFAEEESRVNWCDGMAAAEHERRAY